MESTLNKSIFKWRSTNIIEWWPCHTLGEVGVGLISWFLDVAHRGLLYFRGYCLESLSWPQGLIFLNSEVNHCILLAVWIDSSYSFLVVTDGRIWLFCSPSCCFNLWYFRLFREDNTDHLSAEIRCTYTDVLTSVVDSLTEHLYSWNFCGLVANNCNE